MIRNTSIEAYNKIKCDGLLSTLRFTVYSALYKHGPCTANELVKSMANDGDKTNSRDYFAQRLSELRERGVVSEIGTRLCKVTSRSAIVWDVSDKLPTVPPRKPTKAQKKKELKELLTSNASLFNSNVVEDALYILSSI